MNTADATFIGRHQVSLTNYDNTSLPAIAIGSIVENNGALFKFVVETAISGTAVDGTNYILLVPSGDPSLGTANVTPTWSQTAPTWSDSKQGWYGTGGSANYRYLEFKIIKSTANYKKISTKELLRPVIVRLSDESANLSTIFRFFDPYIPTVGDAFPLNGAMSTTTCAWVARQSTTEIIIVGVLSDGSNTSQISITDTATGSYPISFCFKV